MINSSFKSIEEASQVIGKTWPLYSFVTSNPLSGYEGMPFEKAVNQARNSMRMFSRIHGIPSSMGKG
jgi:uncharacterized protein YbcC (UPF0753/DUF2309 family)